MKQGNFPSRLFFVPHQLWYFVSKIVLTLCETKNVLVIEKTFLIWRLMAENLQIFEITKQFIQTVKGQNNF